MRTAFVIGNGPSRLAVNLESLRPHGTIYACNAIHREFTPDVLVAVDIAMIKEIERTGIQKQIPFYARKPGPNSIQIPQSIKGIDSGSTAMCLAGMEGYEEVFMLGFDLRSKNGQINNIYAGTQNYKPRHAKDATYRRIIAAICKTTHQFPDTKYIRVGDDLYWPEEEWADIRLETWGTQQFLDHINNLQQENTNEHDS